MYIMLERDVVLDWLCPEPGQSAADHIAKLASALQNMEGAVRDAATGIADVETYFRAEDIKK